MRLKLKLNAVYPNTRLYDDPHIYPKFYTPKFYFYNLELSWQFVAITQTRINNFEQNSNYCVSHIRCYSMLSFLPLQSYQSELKHELTTPVMLLAQLLALVKATLYIIVNSGKKLHQSYKNMWKLKLLTSKLIQYEDVWQWWSWPTTQSFNQKFLAHIFQCSRIG